MVLRHSSRPRSHIPLHSRLSSPINYPACQRIDSTVTLCSLLDLRALGLVNVTSLLMTDVSTSGLCIEQCSRGTGLNRYVLIFPPKLHLRPTFLCQVSGHDEWPVIGAALGFPPVPGGDPSRPPRCGPIIAQRLQQLYNEILRHFDQVYISSIVARLRNSQASGQLPPQPPQPQAQPHQPTEADYQALLASITSETPVVNAETMSILPRFSHTSGAELEAHHLPQHVITFVEQNRENLQRAAQDQNGFRTGLTSTKNAPLDNRAQVNHAPALQALARPQQFIPGHQQLQRQGVVQGPGKPNTLQSAQLFNSGSHVPPSTPQTMNASSMQSMGAQIPGSNSSSGVQNQGGIVPVSMSPAAVNGVTSGSIVTQPASTMQVRRMNQEDLVAAKRWIEEKKRMAFSSG
jgi:hypothetical protein